MSPDDTLPMVFVIIGTIASFILALSPVPLIWRVLKTKEVGGFKPEAFIVAIPFGIANGTYSIYSGQTVSFISTMITFLLYSVYLGIFTRFSSQSSKRSIYRKVVIAIVLGAFFTGVGPAVFRIVNSTDSGNEWLANNGGVEKFITTWLGICATISVTLLLSGQVPAMIEVFKTRDARPISLEMTLGGLFASMAWMTYAALIQDVYYTVSNGLGVLCGLILLTLKFMYRKPKTVAPDSTPIRVFENVPLESMSKDIPEQSDP